MESEFKTDTNNEPVCIPCTLHHGGVKRFDKVVWKGSIIDDQTVQFSYVSSDGDKTQITYSVFPDDNEFQWQAQAVTDAETIVNLAHHSYWNLSGNPTILFLTTKFNLMLNITFQLMEDSFQKGYIASVSATPMDFTGIMMNDGTT